jgi:glycosyltransferase involved in cell wall biosynthesis
VNVGFVCCEYPPGPHGGIGSFVQTLARALVGRGHSVRVIGTYAPSYPAPDFEEDHGVRVWRLRHSGRCYGVRGRYDLFRTVTRWAKSGAIELIEVPDWQGLAAAWPALPVPVVVRVHSSATSMALESNEHVGRALAWCERASVRRAEAWCSVSRHAAAMTREALHIETEPRAILYNPVSILEAPPNVTRSTHHVVYTGKLLPIKGVCALAKAWPAVLRECPGAELQVYGRDTNFTEDGTSVQRQMVSRLGSAASSVHFHGHVSRAEIVGALQTARVAVFPSFVEAFAIAPMEAMICGCATIYTCRGPGPELIRDGYDGLLVDPGRPEEIAGAIVHLLRDHNLACQLGERGRLRVQTEFSLERLVPLNEAFYSDTIRCFRSSWRTPYQNGES